MATYTALGNPNDHLEYLEELGSDNDSTRWTINRRAEIGDEFLLYLSAPVSAFVARGIVASVPSVDAELNGDWQSHHMSDIDGLSLLPNRIHIKDLRAQFPEWGWLASPIQSTRVSDEILERLHEMIGSPSPEVDSDDEFLDVDEDAIEASEGNGRLVLHFRRERSQKLVKAKRAAVMREKGNLSCEVCGFDFVAEYGLLEPFCEIHHLTPLSELTKNTKTALSDLAVLCSNCHRVIHRHTPMLTPKQLATQLSGRRRSQRAVPQRAKRGKRR